MVICTISATSDHHRQWFDQQTKVIYWIEVAISILQLVFSSLCIYGVMKNKPLIILTYIFYRYFLIVLNIILGIYLLKSFDSDSDFVALGYILYGGELVVGVILSLYSIFLFIIQYNVLKQGNLSGSHSNPVYIDC